MTECKIGVARIRLTPEREGPIAGWGPGFATTKATPPEHEADELYATAVALEDASGERVIFVNADLHCGSSKVWQQAAQLAGIEREQLILSGTHTHEGPSQMYGGIGLVGASSGLGQIRKNTLRHGELIGQVAKQALSSLAPGGAIVKRAIVTGAASNRALPAWDHYSHYDRNAFFEEGPGLKREEHDADNAIDPRLTALVVASADGTQRAALCWYGVHGTALGPGWPTYSADLFGWARHYAQEQLDGVLVGFGGGSSGDVSPLPLDDQGHERGKSGGRPSGPGQELAQAVGAGLATGVVEAVSAAETAPFAIAAAAELWEPAASGLPAADFGLNQFAGGVDGKAGKWEQAEAGVRSPLYKERAAHARPVTHPQGPKAPWLSAYLKFAFPTGWLGRRLYPRSLPLHAVRIADHIFATVPGEPTSMASWRIEKAVLESGQGASASIIGFANDYCSYWTTPEEYLEQRYEGACTVFGREATTKLTERLAALAKSLK